MEVAQSIQQTSFDQFHKLIKEKSANKAEITKIIEDILESPSLNTFSEFLHLKEIDELKSGEYEKHYNTLNLFAFGTYRQFLEKKQKIISLSPIMDKKLKHLTILTLATQKKTLPYDDLMVELDIANVRHLEDIIIEAIYAELINGKLDQKNRQLEIDYAVAPDIQTENIQDIVNILTDWLKSCESCSSCLQEQIENANAEKVKRAKHKEHLEEKLAEVKKNIKKQSSNTQQQNFEGEDGDFLMGPEKNLNTKEKRGRPKQGTSKAPWFKTFN
ncbi:CLUMA_CG011949, isoform A [Clunio marinus]|uniref:CLUMA_CG011949, isoform A n=1 Tax=Clunio marinus TaxID=568069 RepID=A0A1J1IF56_9DIPT|nr:CLUMA_CG011949, isoform A [Clunio marinus]